MAKFFIVADETHKAYVNVDMICMFRLKVPEDNNLMKPDEVEIEFIGGGKTRLVGESAEHFVGAAVQWMGGI